jgi:hypothetical protein
MSNCNRYLSLLFASCALLASSAVSATGEKHYEVTITNLTRAEAFTPILVATHRGDVSIFEPGSPASDELAALAEGGDTAPLTALLQANDRVVDIQQTGDLLVPGASVSVQVMATAGARSISLASMMIPTNDGFIALNNVAVPLRGEITYYSPGYDAGSEPNDELCISIPGPVCGGEGGSPGTGGEGYVHINSGIHGIGDLAPEIYDWRNPVAKITIRRMTE